MGKATWAKWAIGTVLVWVLIGAGCSYSKPKITIIAPPKDAIIEVGQEVAVQSMATDRLGLKKVELWVDQKLVSSDGAPTGSGPALAMKQLWTPEEPGPHTLTLLAYNRLGDVSDPAWVTVQVVEAGAAVGSDGCKPAMEFVEHVTVPDKTVVAPNEVFAKTWRVRNTGDCEWSGYSLVALKGDTMGVQKDGIQKVPPGAIVDISTKMFAPAELGAHEGVWGIQTPAGETIGALNCLIVVEASGDALSDGCTGGFEFVSDVTIPSKSRMTAGRTFVKTWRVRNASACDWKDLLLVGLKGETFGVVKEPVPNIAAGQEVEISVKMTAPGLAGTYEGAWAVLKPNGTELGTLSASIVVPPKPRPGACTNAMRFIQDITLPDKVAVSPGAKLTKTWRVRNSGSCDWLGYQIIHVGGADMGLPSAPVPKAAAGETIDISGEITMPDLPGEHIAFWRIQSPAGDKVGTLSCAVTVKVGAPAPPLPTIGAPAPAPPPPAPATPPPPAPAPPAAPTGLAVTGWGGSLATMVFADNSDNEQGFRVYANGGVYRTLGANEVSFQVGPGCGHTYSVQVTSFNAAGESASSNTIAVSGACPTPPPTVPAAPDGLAVVSWAGNMANFAFNDRSDNEQGFRVYANGGVYRNLGAGVTTFQVGPACGSTYSVRVTAYNAAGESASSNTIAVSGACPTVVPAVPAAPDSLAVVSWSGTMANLAFNDGSDNEQGFRVYANGGVYRNLGAGVTTFQVGPACGSTYSVQVKAYNAAGESAGTNTINVAGACTPAPAAVPNPPAGLALTNRVDSMVVMQYQDNATDEAGFRVYLNDALHATLPVNQQMFQFPTTCGSHYTVRVTAYNASGESTPSNTINLEGNCPAVTSPPAEPSSLAVTSWEDRMAVMAFNDNSSDEEGFRVYANGGVYRVLAPNTTTFQVGPGCGSTYAVEVKAYNAAGESAGTGVINVGGRCP